MDIDKIIENSELNVNWQKYLTDIKQCYHFDREQLRQYAFEQINAQLPEIIKNTPYYKSLYDLHLIPSKVNSWEEFERMPFVTKQDLRDNYPFGFLKGSMCHVIRYGESTGTSGKPTASFMSKKDWEENIARVTVHLSHYFSQQDIVFIMLPYELTFSSVDMDKSLWNIGSCIVAIGTQNQICPIDRVADMMLEVRPTALICSPTRAIRLYYLLKDRGYNPLDIGLKTILYIGETCSDAKLNKIKDLWGVRLTTVYGSSETNSIALPCEYNRSHLTEDRHYFELINPKSGMIVNGEGSGELVITTLKHEMFPLIRYRTGDYVQIENAKCSCGLNFRTIKHLGRCSDEIGIQGQSFMKNELEDLVLSVPGTGCNFVCCVDNNDLYIAVDIIGENWIEIKEEIIECIQQKYEIIPVVYQLNRNKYFKAVDTSLKPGNINWSSVV